MSRGLIGQDKVAALRERPAAIKLLFGNDEMFAFDDPTIRAVGRKLQGMVQHR